VSAATVIPVPAPTFSVTAPEVPPPVKPLPATTEVMSPTVIEPPNETAIPLIVIEEFVRPAFGTVPKESAPEPFVNNTVLAEPSDVGNVYAELNWITPPVEMLIRVVVLVLRFKPELLL